MSPSFPRTFAAALVLCILVTSCQTSVVTGTLYDVQADAEPAATEPQADVFTIRRAESPQNGEWYDTGAALNVPRKAASVNDTARLLAGLPALGSGGDAYPDVRSSTGWQSHAERLGSLWSDYEARHQQPIRRWAAREISDLQSASSLFYPFSGPDFLFADAFFPRAETVVLCGLESAEPLPQLTSLTGSDIESGLTGLRNSLNSVIQFSFFITKDMRNDLQATRFRGVLPVILVFLARSGHSVESVDAIRLDAAGNPVLAHPGQGATGLLIRAHSPRGSSRRIFYFKQDLSNDGLRAGSPFLRFVAQLGRPPVFTKSASYLMHEGSFSTIRDYILHSCGALVQDPSGVPYDQMLKSEMNIRLYGNYKGTLDMFREHAQPDLIAGYQSGAHHAQPLDFGIGYLYNPTATSLMVGRPTR